MMKIDGTPREIAGIVNDEPAMVSVTRLGVGLLPKGVTPVITEVPNSYDLGARTLTIFDVPESVTFAESPAKGNSDPSMN